MPEGPEVKISTDFLKKNAREVKSINIESAPYKKKFYQVIKIANKHLTKKTSFFCIGKNIFLRLSKTKPTSNIKTKINIISIYSIIYSPIFSKLFGAKP